MTRPGTTIGEAPPDALMPLGLEVTVKLRIAAPPSLAGAVNETVACALPAVAIAAVGAPGTVTPGDGVVLAVGDDAGPTPTPFVAVTVNV